MLAADDLDVELDDVRLLVRRTEGWPAGMRLAALFLRDPARSPGSFAGDDQAVTDYLVGEVLSSQPPEVQRFLLRTSVAERVSSGLAEALTDEPRAQHPLARLERSNAFVVGLGPGREWFRYHALLREVLQHRLRVEDPGAPADVHRRAAVWFAAHERPLDAMRHAADAEDWLLLGELFVTHALPLIVSADRAAVDRVLARIPRERLADGPALALCAAARMMHAGRFEEMGPYLELARSSVGVLRANPGRGRAHQHGRSTTGEH
jgi:LuxR family maltose regulon positive regulatory protein